MPSYLMYFPKARGFNPEHLVAAGLGDLLADGSPLFADVPMHGPDGGHGMLAWWDGADPPRPCVESAGQQEWREFAGGKFWLGREKGRPVRPADLARPGQHPGRDVVLADGQAWHVPVARQLPHILGLGKPRVKDAYRAFWDQATAALEWLKIVDDAPAWFIPWSEDNSPAFQLAVAALSLNYRVNDCIVDWLGLLATDCLVPVIETITEGDALRRTLELLQKKTSMSDMPPIDAGGMD